MHTQETESEHHWIVRLWRFAVLLLYFSALAIGIILWILSGNSPESLNLIMVSVTGIIVAALAVHSVFSVNILGRMKKLEPNLERTFVFLSAIGLYLFVSVAIVFSSIPLMQVMQLPNNVVTLVLGAECGIFLLVGYKGFDHLKQQVEYYGLSKTT